MDKETLRFAVKCLDLICYAEKVAVFAQLLDPLFVNTVLIIKAKSKDR